MIFQVMSSEGRRRVSDGQSIVSSEEKLKLETLWQKRKEGFLVFARLGGRVVEDRERSECQVQFYLVT